MPIEVILIERFLELSQQYPVLDVRSPGEYAQAHFPGAISIPLFTDEQRKIIGTAYKQQSREVAVDLGLNFFSSGMKTIPQEVNDMLQEKGINKNKSIHNRPASETTILVHCWRGGMRSEAVAWLLSLFGYTIYALKGGYKAYRRWALRQFELKYSLKILGGFTGSGKTEVLMEMREKGKVIIDLEKLANHKGSAFGSLGQELQPGQEMFENLLAMELWKATSESKTNTEAQTKTETEIWLEDESRHIGSVGIPQMLWEQMRNAPLYFLDIPREERLNFIVSQYGGFDKKLLVTSIMKIQKRLGGLETKNAINFLLEGRVKDCFSILIGYFDKLYFKAMNNRENIDVLLNKIPCESVTTNNAGALT